MKEFKETGPLPAVLATAVGSLPHSSSEDAVDLITTSLKAAPHIPQLSKSDPREQMWIQFSENLPRFRADLENLSYGFDTSGDPGPEIEEFYTHYLEVSEGGTPDYFAVGDEYGRGIHTFFDRLKTAGKKWPFLKVQVTGPLSFALTVTDEQKRPIFYHPLFRDVAVKAMGLKAVWLLEQAKAYADNVIVFFDEPSMSAYGSSAFLGVSMADVVESLDDVISMVLERGGIPGVHCCGNTDWGILMATQTRILNFDAVDYMETMAIYGGELSRFLERGGVLAWGAVRNTAIVEKETAQDVVLRIEEGAEIIRKSGVDRDALLEKVIITPACGCAGLTVQHTEKVYGLLSELDSITGFGRPE